MEYKKILISLQEYPDRFYRTLLIRSDLNLVYFGCFLCTVLRTSFMHLFLFNINKKSYVSDAFLYEISDENWFPMKDFNIDDLGDNFEFEYDTGCGWIFDCKVIDTIVKNDDEFVYLLDGKGQGIWEDNKYSLIKYLDGDINEDMSDEISLPWNHNNNKFSDFDIYDLEKEKIYFYRHYIRDANKLIKNSHDYGFELEIKRLPNK